MRDSSTQSLQPRPRGFTLVEVMVSLIIFAMVATAGTYLMGATNNTETFFRDGTTSQSEVEFALGRIVENVRAATAITSPSVSGAASSTLTLTNISGATVTYAVDHNDNLTESVGGATNTLVHGVATFSVSGTGSPNPMTFSINLSAGTEEPISRQITVFARNVYYAEQP